MAEPCLDTAGEEQALTLQLWDKRKRFGAPSGHRFQPWEAVAVHTISATRCQTQQELPHSLAHCTASRGASGSTAPIAAPPASASTLAPSCTTSTAFLETRGVLFDHSRIRKLWRKFLRTRIFRRCFRRRRSSACGGISAHLLLRRFFDVPVATANQQIGVGLQSVTLGRESGPRGQEVPFTDCFIQEVATCCTLNSGSNGNDLPGLQAQASGLLEYFVDSEMHQGIVVHAI